jgi:hypothetical protein
MGIDSPPQKPSRPKKKKGETDEWEVFEYQQEYTAWIK